VQIVDDPLRVSDKLGHELRIKSIVSHLLSIVSRDGVLVTLEKSAFPK